MDIGDLRLILARCKNMMKKYKILGKKPNSGDTDYNQLNLHIWKMDYWFICR